MKRTPVTLVCGAAAIVITILLYRIAFSNLFLRAINLVTLFGVIFAEMITTFFAYISNGNPRRVAMVTLSALTIPISIALSITYIVSFPFGYVTYICWYLLFVILVDVIAYIIFRFDVNKSDESAELANAKANMLHLRKIVKLIIADPASAAYKGELEKLEEKLHFSNDSVIASQDTSIFDLLSELQSSIGAAEYDVPNALAKINLLIDERNIICSRKA